VKRRRSGDLNEIKAIIMTQQTSKTRQKITEWLHRYVPSEIAAIATAYLGFWYVFTMTHNHTAASYASAMTENIGFYSVILFREYMKGRKQVKITQIPYTVSAFLQTCLVLLLEFGPGELLDSFIVRPITIGLATHYFGMELGVLVGKLSADVTFFIPTILIYEMRKSYEAKKRVA
jgi:hypothetical protein